MSRLIPSARYDPNNRRESSDKIDKGFDHAIDTYIVANKYKKKLEEKDAEIEQLQNQISEMGQHLIDYHHCEHDWSRLPSVVDKEGMLGFFEGEICNRNGCDGIIEEHPVENCSCHIVSPCSACVLDRNYCPKCEWEAEDE